MIEPRLRAILLGIAAAGFAGMIAELLLVEHWGLPWQITHQRGFEPFMYDGRFWVRRGRATVAPCHSERLVFST